MSLRGLGAALIRPLLDACAVAAVVLVVRSFIEPALLRLGLGVALAGLVYLPFVWPLRPYPPRTRLSVTPPSHRIPGPCVRRNEH